MSRYRGPKLRITRRLGELPGLTTKVATRDTLPGQHKIVRGKQGNVSSYSIRLQEKQKLRYNYGLTEKQLLAYVKEAKRLKGSTGSLILQLLEMRLDNVVFRSGLGPTIPAARQLVNHGHITVNGNKVTIPSFQCRSGDILAVKDKPTSKTLALISYGKPSNNQLPNYLEFDKTTLEGKVKKVAEASDANINVNELLIVEYYSRK
jgi:small subunit ribosomal protein S4